MAVIALAQRIRAWRMARGVAIPELAERIGVTAPAIHQWESGTTEPTVANVVRAIDALGLSPQKFWGSMPRRRS